MQGAEAEMAIGPLVQGRVDGMERPALQQPAPVLALAQVVGVDDAEPAVAPHAAPGRRVQKQDLRRPVAVDATAAVLLPHQPQRLGEACLGQLHGAPAAPVGTGGIRRREHSAGAFLGRLTHPDARQALGGLRTLPVDREHARIGLTPAPAGTAQHLGHEARLRPAVGPADARRAEHGAGGALGECDGAVPAFQGSDSASH